EQRDREQRHVGLNVDRVIPLACQDQHGQCGCSEEQLHDDMGSENRLRPERRGAKSPQDAAFAIDRDDGDQGRTGLSRRGMSSDANTGRSTATKLLTPGGTTFNLLRNRRPTMANINTGTSKVPKTPSGSRTKILISSQVSFQRPRSMKSSVTSRGWSDRSAS